MRAEELLRHYERVADAPDAVGRMRRLVLDLAVRGKLIDQVEADEPAASLLRRIAEEKSAGLTSVSGKFVSAVAPLSGAGPYDIPFKWVWVPLGAVVTSHVGGGTPSKSNSAYWGGPIPWASVKDIGKAKYVAATVDSITSEGLAASSSNLVGPGSLIVVTRMGLGKLSINTVPMAINQDLRALRFSSLVSIAFVYNFFKTHQYEGTGLTVKGIRVEELLSTWLPLPPLPEQHRIVAKVDELMALCDGLEAARAEREAARDRLAAASLARLNTPDPETFADDARFALDALPALTARPDQIKQLRKTILNLAVRGKLVTQDPRDQPAALLIAQIATETASQRLAGSGRRRKELPVLDIDLVPFELPTGWAWARFPDLGHFGRGKSKHRPRNDPALFEGGTHLLIQTGDVARSRGVIRTHTGRYNEVGLAQSQRWPAGTLCITIAANIADSGILSFEACFPDSVVGFVPSRLFDNARYFEYFVRTAKANLLEFAPATAQKNINLEILESMLIPLPPLNEQRRMVAKIDELMILCDQVELSLEALDQHVATLFDALIHKAVERADALGEAA